MDTFELAKFVAAPHFGSAGAMMSMVSAARCQSTKRRIAEALDSTDAIDQFLAFVGSGPHTPSPEIGFAYDWLRIGKPKAAAMQLCLELSKSELDQTIELQVEDCELFFQGYLFRVSDRCTLRSAGGQLTFSSSAGYVEFRKLDEGWKASLSEQFIWRAHRSTGSVPFYFVESGIVVDKEAFPDARDYPLAAPRNCKDEIARDVCRIRDGWELLSEVAPVYVEWVRNAMVGALMVKNQTSESTTSGSDVNRPGLVAIEPNESPLYMGDVLVHECSHQYLDAFSLLAPLVDPDVKEQFFSPIKNANRDPLFMLQAAHAIINMTIFYELCADASPLGAYEQKKLAKMKHWLKSDYVVALDQSTALTPAGRAVWDNANAALNEFTG